MSERTRMHPIDILLIEDNPGDVRLIREAFRNSGSGHSRLHPVPDGVEAMGFLRRAGPYATAPTPDLIVLDLNLPKKDGRAVLAEVKQDPQLRRIPIIVLTTSNAEQDILRSYDLQANCYIPKPVDLERFLAVVRAIENFWLTVATLPSEARR